MSTDIDDVTKVAVRGLKIPDADLVPHGIVRRHLSRLYLECAKVGIPYGDSQGLVRHHRVNASAAAQVDGFTTLIKELQGIADTIEAEMVCCDAYAANDSPPAGHEICYWAGASRAVVLARLEVIKKGGA